jgi:putative PIN family toxin of toxin-antitoxin system
MVRPRIHRFLAPLLAQRFLSLLHHYAVMTTPTANTPAGRDPKDDMVIATALGGQADFIVTSDRDLLDDDSLKQTLAPYHLHIISPAEFLKQLDP